MKKELAQARQFINKKGYLMLSHTDRPSLVTMITGEKVKGSWWGHKKGNLIYNISQALEDDPKILTVKWIDGKITFLHQKYWDAFFSYVIENAKAPLKLKPESQKLLQLIRKKKKVRADDSSLKLKPADVAKWAKVLEEKQLVYSRSVHTESGKHVRLLMTWETLIHEMDPEWSAMDFQKAEKALQKLLI